jgi:hypothetical protein
MHIKKRKFKIVIILKLFLIENALLSPSPEAAGIYNCLFYNKIYVKELTLNS